jgi:hypothetical protein
MYRIHVSGFLGQYESFLLFALEVRQRANGRSALVLVTTPSHFVLSSGA